MAATGGSTSSRTAIWVAALPLKRERITGDTSGIGGHPGEREGGLVTQAVFPRPAGC